MATDAAERDEQERRRVGPVTFAKEVRSEARKVTWTSRQETVIFTIFVLALVVLAAAFFALTDSIIHFLVDLLLQLGGFLNSGH